MVLLLLALLAGPGGSVLEARLEASNRNGDGISVRLDYRIEATPDLEEISFAALELEGTSLEELDAFEGENPVEIRLERSRSPRLEGALVLAPSLSETRELTISYVVRGKRLVVPVVVLGLEPSAARPGAFSARLAQTEGSDFPGSFPASPSRGEDGSYLWELPLVPAFVALEPPEATKSGPGISAAGSSFFGLFLVFAAVVALYLVWMRRVEA